MVADGRRLGFVALILGAFLIAFAAIFVRLSSIPPTATAFDRMLLALPLYGLWILWERKRLHARGEADPPVLTRGQIGGLILAGLFFAADLGTWHISILLTSVANATLMANMAPVVVTLFAWLVLRERIRFWFIVGLALSLSGAYTLMRASISIGHRNLVGDALGLLTACFYAGYLLSVKNLRNSLSTGRLMGVSTLVSCVALGMAAAVLGEPLLPRDLRGFLVVLGLAWTCQVAGQGLIAYGMAHLPASFSAVSLLVQPVGAAALGWAILGEAVSWHQALGGAMVVTGIMLARRASLAGGRGAGSA